MTHVLKVEKQWADAKLAGDKVFEIRRNDRGFQKGDHIVYRVVDPKTKKPYTKPWTPEEYGRDNTHPLEHCEFYITYVQEGVDGLEKGFCVFADQPVLKGSCPVSADLPTGPLGQMRDPESLPGTPPLADAPKYGGSTDISISQTDPVDWTTQDVKDRQLEVLEAVRAVDPTDQFYAEVRS